MTSLPGSPPALAVTSMKLEHVLVHDGDTCVPISALPEQKHLSCKNSEIFPSLMTFHKISKELMSFFFN